ncbi:heme exporter protein CcmD [Rhodoblastus acidophilus]|uniref:Heme exporter protein D n=1 Tax=Rhodoblastus acidophilus TaxID=1074 RepID=A0A212RLC2_RHOAC|nr:heme exporter protein CcmD [Rhodoblastus acidophilus]MCW2315848.1 heme exporter protein CcmD [Rhodoblastus acidophilus]PPQ39207.1 heme exporter protein CcmD [Rhodoblastus acidophilus]RAI24247.1 heme exporter protein CcmD [Rhodoblastus acidophilus]SNB73215.1 heme exporter protein CcmD [Rhodoblastus acidophilus]
MKDYSGFIFAAYAFAAIVVGAMIVKIVADYRDLKRKLARFDGREIKP